MLGSGCAGLLSELFSCFFFVFLHMHRGEPRSELARMIIYALVPQLLHFSLGATAFRALSSLTLYSFLLGDAG